VKTAEQKALEACERYGLAAQRLEVLEAIPCRCDELPDPTPGGLHHLDCPCRSLSESYISVRKHYLYARRQLLQVARAFAGGFRKGDKVRMTKAFKLELQRECATEGCKPDAEGVCERLCSTDHVKEFGECVGVVEGPLDYNNKGEPYVVEKVGPELNVRWQPSGLRYGYHPDQLERVPE
jgi:hypothetical protein